MPSQGTAKLTRTLSWGIVSAADHVVSAESSTCTPLLRRMEGSAAGSASRRTSSTQGPAALTTVLADTAMVSPSATTSAPLTRPSDESQRRHRSAVDDSCAVLGRGSDVGEGEPTVVRDAVDVEAAAAQTRRAETRHHAQRPLRRDEPVEAGAGERRVEGDPRLDDHRAVRAGVVEREQERQGPDQVRRDAGHQQAALLVRFPYEAHVAEAQVPQPSVDELRRCARGLPAEVAALDERHREPVPGCGRGDAGADYPAAHDQQIEVPAGELFERTGAVRPEHSAHG